jgi:hypothetical protein
MAAVLISLAGATDMPRLRRLDFRGAHHIVRVRGRDGERIFFDESILMRIPRHSRDGAPCVQRFEQLLGEACTECGVLLQAYGVEPNVAIFVLQTLGAPLEAFMLRLSGQYSRYLHRDGFLPKSINPFAGRYVSKVLAPEYVPHAVRRVHRSPLQAGLCRRPAEYPFSSAPTYVGWPPRIALDIRGVQTALEKRGFSGLRGIRDFMELDETAYVASLFERGAALDTRIVGSKLFVMEARGRAAHPLPGPTREQLIAGVARLLSKSPHELYGSTRTGVLGRSLVAWYGLHGGTASLKEIGTWFCVSGATLGHGIRYHRRAAPELFKRRVLPGSDHQTGTELADANHEVF